MDKKLKEDIESIVTSIFSEKEQANQRQKTQDALNDSAKTIENLTQSLEDIKTELATVKDTSKEELTAKDSELSKINDELEAAQTKLEKTEVELSASEESLEGMKKDQLAEVRMVELKNVKVSMETDIKSQTAKVREMTDEEFASYKTERVELRKAVKKELEDAAALAADTDGNDTDVSSTEGGTETASTDDDVNTVPANIPAGQAIAAAMNFETNPSENMVSKYAEMGKAMAKKMTPKSDK